MRSYFLHVLGIEIVDVNKLELWLNMVYELWMLYPIGILLIYDDSSVNLHGCISKGGIHIYLISPYMMVLIALRKL